jgi:hypothetical protein
MKLSNTILILGIISLFISCREDKIVFPEEPVNAAVYVDSYPIGASIFLRNEFTDKITPAWIDDLTPGRYYRITLKYNGFVDTTVSVRLDTLQRQRRFIQLRKDN